MSSQLGSQGFNLVPTIQHNVYAASNQLSMRIMPQDGLRQHNIFRHRSCDRKFCVSSIQMFKEPSSNSDLKKLQFRSRRYDKLIMNAGKAHFPVPSLNLTSNV